MTRALARVMKRAGELEALAPATTISLLSNKLSVFVIGPDACAVHHGLITVTNKALAGDWCIGS